MVEVHSVKPIKRPRWVENIANSDKKLDFFQISDNNSINSDNGLTVSLERFEYRLYTFLLFFLTINM